MKQEAGNRQEYSEKALKPRKKAGKFVTAVAAGAAAMGAFEREPRAAPLEDPKLFVLDDFSVTADGVSEDDVKNVVEARSFVEQRMGKIGKMYLWDLGKGAGSRERYGAAYVRVKRLGKTLEVKINLGEGDGRKDVDAMSAANASIAQDIKSEDPGVWEMHQDWKIDGLEENVVFSGYNRKKKTGGTPGVLKDWVGEIVDMVKGSDAEHVQGLVYQVFEKKEADNIKAEYERVKAAAEAASKRPPKWVDFFTPEQKRKLDAYVRDKYFYIIINERAGGSAEYVPADKFDFDKVDRSKEVETPHGKKKEVARFIDVKFVGYGDEEEYNTLHAIATAWAAQIHELGYKGNVIIGENGDDYVITFYLDGPSMDFKGESFTFNKKNLAEADRKFNQVLKKMKEAAQKRADERAKLKKSGKEKSEKEEKKPKKEAAVTHEIQFYPPEMRAFEAEIKSGIQNLVNELKSLNIEAHLLVKIIVEDELNNGIFIEVTTKYGRKKHFQKSVKVATMAVSRGVHVNEVTGEEEPWEEKVRADIPDDDIRKNIATAVDALSGEVKAALE